jgi:hypothetical protein
VAFRETTLRHLGACFSNADCFHLGAGQQLPRVFQVPISVLLKALRVLEGATGSAPGEIVPESNLGEIATPKPNCPGFAAIPIPSNDA